jgi:hypothetical protein
MINSSRIVLYPFFLKYLIRYFICNVIASFIVVDYDFE